MSLFVAGTSFILGACVLWSSDNDDRRHPVVPPSVSPSPRDPDPVDSLTMTRKTRLNVSSRVVSPSLSPSPRDPNPVDSLTKADKIELHGLAKTDKARLLVNSQVTSSPASFGTYLQYCNSPNSTKHQNKDSLEGTLTFDQQGRFKLLQIFMLARHGDRMPVYSFPSLFPTPRLNCSLPEVWDDVVEQKNKGFKVKDISKPESASGPLISPWQKKVKRNQPCDIGSLTRRGHEQHLILGQHFRQTYMEWFDEPRFAGNWTDFAFVHSTDVQRTMYSAASFLLGFLPMGAAYRSKVPIHISKGISLNGAPPGTKLVYRGCKLLNSITAKEVTAKDLEAGHSLYSGVLDRIAMALGVSKGKLPSKVTQLFDQIIVRMCHNLTIPSRPGRRIDAALVSELREYAEWANAQLFPKTTALLLLQPFVYNTLYQHANGAVVNDRQGRSDYLKFLLHFCHDTTLTAFLSSMAAPRRRWPPYATRIVLELWKDKMATSKMSEDPYYVRFLFNGQPITSELHFDPGDFAHGQELLKFAAWSKYITTGKYRAKESYDKVCGLAPP